MEAIIILTVGKKNICSPAGGVCTCSIIMKRFPAGLQMKETEEQLILQSGEAFLLAQGFSALTFSSYEKQPKSLHFAGKQTYKCGELS